MTTSTTERAARIIAAAIIHGTSGDPALEAAQQLDTVGLLSTDETTAGPVPARPVPSPAAVAALAKCRRAKEIADSMRVQTDGMPGEPDVSAAGGEVTLVVHPRSLADWKQWTHMLGAGGVRGTSTGVSMVVRCTYGGVRARLVGVGVPGMLTEMYARSGGRTAVCS